MIARGGPRLSRPTPNVSGKITRLAMRIPQPGNGSGKFDVGVHDIGGWVRVIAGGTAPQDGNLPFYLAHRLSHWLWENAHLRLLCVVPISKGGNTVELQGFTSGRPGPGFTSLSSGEPGTVGLSPT